MFLITLIRLLGYYAYLQCVKGWIVTKLKINPIFFSQHGITGAPDNEFFIKTECKPIGVLSAMILASYPFVQTKEMLNFFIIEKYQPTLPELITHQAAHGNPVFAFIGSFMLSSLVRYQPKTWAKISRRQKNRYPFRD